MGAAAWPPRPRARAEAVEQRGGGVLQQHRGQLVRAGGHDSAPGGQVEVQAAVAVAELLGGRGMEGVRAAGLGAEQLLVLGHQPAGVLGVRGRDDVPLVVLGDRQQPVQVGEVSLGRAHRFGQPAGHAEPELFGAHLGADGGQRAEHPADRAGVAGGEQVGQVLGGHAQRLDGGEHLVRVVVVVPGGVHDVGDRGQRRDVPDHRQRPVLRVQGERHPVPGYQRVDGGAAGRVQPVGGDALRGGRGPDVRVVRGRGRPTAGRDTGPAGPGWPRRRAPCRRRRGPARGSGAGRRRFPSRSWAGRPRCAGSTACTSPPCRCGG